MASNIITIDDIPVTLTRKSMKNIRLAVKSSTGEVRLSAPHHVSTTTLTAFLYEHLPWLRTQRDEFYERAKRTLPKYEEGERHYLWGEQKRLRFGSHANTSHFSLPVSNDDDVILLKNGEASMETREAALHDFYRVQLQRAMNVWVPHYQERMELSASEWRIRRMKTRWGSCNIQRKRIWLNLYLAAYPEHCLHYVIVHELAHLLEANHSPRFWSIVETFFPDWKAVRAELNSRQLVWC